MNAAWVAAVLGLVFLAPAHALGLGELTLKSTLGEPLRAEIRVLDLAAEDAASLRAVVATPETFLAAGADYNPVLAAVRVEVFRRADGTYLLRLAGTRAMEDEFVDLIIDASASSGRVLRDYTLQLPARGSRPKP